MYSGKVTNRNLKFEMDNSKRFTHEIGAAWIVGGGVKYTHNNVNPGEVELSIGALGFLGGSVTLDTNGNVTNWFGGINIDAHIAIYFGIQGTYKLGFAK